MEQLLPYYERELGLFRRHSREFAERFPKAAGNLLIAGETCADPHVERLIQSFALLTARVAKRLDDDYPQLTESLLETLYPHYLRPFPSCSIARFDSAAGENPQQVETIARGSVLRSAPVRGVQCQFRTACDVVLAPLTISKVTFNPILNAPPALRLGPQATSLLSIELSASVATLGLRLPGLTRLRLFADGEASVCAALIDTLFLRTSGAYLELDGDPAWLPLARVPLLPAGFDEHDALIPFSARSHPAFRLLTEYFSFPEKFNFFDLDWTALAPLLPPSCPRVTLRLVINGLRSDSATARLLAGIGAHNLLSGCAPVVNLFAKSGTPVAVKQTSADYTVTADAKHASAYEIHSITAVALSKKAAGGDGGDGGDDVITQFQPLYATPYGTRPEQAGQHGHYWLARKNERLADISPGHETRITLVTPGDDIGGGTLSVEMLCTNRDLPLALHYGLPGGDLEVESTPGAAPARLLRKPSQPWRFAAGEGAHWRLISHLSLNYSGLCNAGLDDFRKMLALYDLPNSAVSQRQINGITGLDHGSVRCWISTIPFATLMPGIAIRMTVDEQAFVGSGLFVFSAVMERYFSLNSQLNCFTRLSIVSQQTGEVLISCKPRCAEPTRN